MCGIAGAFAFNGELPPGVLDALSRISAALQHRGPDAAGTWVTPDRRAAFVATRLAIRDLRSIADQPFISDRGATVYNGELYDWPALPHLASHARTSGDTEVIHNLVCTDPLLLTRVSGMYAVATFRTASHSLVLARDPAGEKPLYLVRGEHWLAFASELTALVKVGLLARDVDPGAVAMLLRFGHVPEPFCIYKAARPLSSGTILEIHPSGDETVHSWWPSQQMGTQKFDAPTVRQAVIDAVGNATVSDVPAGIFLSGGVDSSVVAAAAQTAGCDLTAFTVTTPQGSHDESSDASRTARHLGMRHHVIMIEPDEARRHLPEFFDSMDQPTVNGFNSYLVCKAARSAGLIVALSGVGGDELFRGYNTFAKMERARWLRRVRGGGTVLSWVARTRGFRHERMADLLIARDDREAYVAIRGVLGKERTERLLGGPIDWDGLLQRLDLPTFNHRGDRATSSLEIHGYMRNQLLRDLDIFAMACSLEVRAPLLSPRLLSIAGAMPNRRRLRGKRILKDAFRDDLPAGLFDRPKRGFNLPWKLWLQTSLHQDTMEFLNDLPRTRSLVDPDEAVALFRDFERGRLHWSGLWVVVALHQWDAAHQGRGLPRSGVKA